MPASHVGLKRSVASEDLLLPRAGAMLMPLLRPWSLLQREGMALQKLSVGLPRQRGPSSSSTDRIRDIAQFQKDMSRLMWHSKFYCRVAYIVITTNSYGLPQSSENVRSAVGWMLCIAIWLYSRVVAVQ